MDPADGNARSVAVLEGYRAWVAVRCRARATAVLLHPIRAVEENRVVMLVCMAMSGHKTRDLGQGSARAWILHLVEVFGIPV